MVQTDRQTSLSPQDYHYNTTGALSTCHIALTSSRVVQGKCFSLINYYYRLGARVNAGTGSKEHGLPV